MCRRHLLDMFVGYKYLCIESYNLLSTKDKCNPLGIFVNKDKLLIALATAMDLSADKSSRLLKIGPHKYMGILERKKTTVLFGSTSSSSWVKKLIVVDVKEEEARKQAPPAEALPEQAPPAQAPPAQAPPPPAQAPPPPAQAPPAQAPPAQAPPAQAPPPPEQAPPAEALPEQALPAQAPPAPAPPPPAQAPPAQAPPAQAPPAQAPPPPAQAPPPPAQAPRYVTLKMWNVKKPMTFGKVNYEYEYDNEYIFTNPVVKDITDPQQFADVVHLSKDRFDIISRMRGKDTVEAELRSTWTPHSPHLKAAWLQMFQDEQITVSKGYRDRAKAPIQFQIEKMVTMLTEALTTSRDQIDIPSFNKRQLMVKENAFLWATSLKKALEKALEKENIPVKFPSLQEGYSSDLMFPLKEMAKTMVSDLQALINQKLVSQNDSNKIQRELLVTAIAQVQQISLVHKAQCLSQLQIISVSEQLVKAARGLHVSQLPSISNYLQKLENAKTQADRLLKEINVIAPDAANNKTTLVLSKDWKKKLRKLALPLTSTAAAPTATVQHRLNRYRHLIGHEAQGRDFDDSTQLASDEPTFISFASDINAGDLVLVLQSNDKWTYAGVMSKTASDVRVWVKALVPLNELIEKIDTMRWHLKTNWEKEINMGTLDESLQTRITALSFECFRGICAQPMKEDIINKLCKLYNVPSFTPIQGGRRRKHGRHAVRTTKLLHGNARHGVRSKRKHCMAGTYTSANGNCRVVSRVRRGKVGRIRRRSSRKMTRV